MHNTIALIPIKGGFIHTPRIASTRRKEDASRQSTIQCECGCPCCNKSEEPSAIDCFIGTSLALVCIVVGGFCMFKIVGCLYDIFNKPSTKE